MIVHKIKYWFCFIIMLQRQLGYASLVKEFESAGYIEFFNHHGVTTFNQLYICFDDLIEFLQTNPKWIQILYSAKERFIRTSEQRFACDFLGLYDESQKEDRCQISFYYSIDFHQFLYRYYAECLNQKPIYRFLSSCYDLQKSYIPMVKEIIHELKLDAIFDTEKSPPLLLKIIKYFPAYKTPRPHYDGSALTFFLNSTDDKSLLLAPYKNNLTINDFSSPLRQLPQNNDHGSILLIPGALLTQYSIFPTPHVVRNSGMARYATINFVLRPHQVLEKYQFASLDFESK